MPYKQLNDVALQFLPAIFVIYTASGRIEITLVEKIFFLINPLSGDCNSWKKAIFPILSSPS
jgi:hypothetical protein